MLFCCFFFFHNVYAVRMRQHSCRDNVAQEWCQRQREGPLWRDAVVNGEAARPRAHGRAAQGQWRPLTRRLNSMMFFDLRSHDNNSTALEASCSRQHCPLRRNHETSANTLKHHIHTLKQRTNFDFENIVSTDDLFERNNQRATNRQERQDVRQYNRDHVKLIDRRQASRDTFSMSM